MKVFLNRKNSNISANGEYDMETKALTVLAGSRVSDEIAHSEKFRGAKTIEKNRAVYTTNGIVSKNVVFKSASTAANFVTGSSTNGLVAWKDENGRHLKDILTD